MDPPRYIINTILRIEDNFQIPPTYNYLNIPSNNRVFTNFIKSWRKDNSYLGKVFEVLETILKNAIFEARKYRLQEWYIYIILSNILRNNTIKYYINKINKSLTFK